MTEGTNCHTTDAQATISRMLALRDAAEHHDDERYHQAAWGATDNMHLSERLGEATCEEDGASIWIDTFTGTLDDLGLPQLTIADDEPTVRLDLDAYGRVAAPKKHTYRNNIDYAPDGTAWSWTMVECECDRPWRHE